MKWVATSKGWTKLEFRVYGRPKVYEWRVKHRYSLGTNLFVQSQELLHTWTYDQVLLNCVYSLLYCKWETGKGGGVLSMKDVLATSVSFPAPITPQTSYIFMWQTIIKFLNLLKVENNNFQMWDNYACLLSCGYWKRGYEWPTWVSGVMSIPMCPLDASTLCQHLIKPVFKKGKNFRFIFKLIFYYKWDQSSPYPVMFCCLYPYNVLDHSPLSQNSALWNNVILWLLLNWLRSDYKIRLPKVWRIWQE